jgi:hypothetical protein
VKTTGLNQYLVAKENKEKCRKFRKCRSECMNVGEGEGRIGSKKAGGKLIG